MTPALTRSSYSCVAALKPNAPLPPSDLRRRRSSRRRPRSPRSGAAAPRARGARCRRRTAARPRRLSLSSAVEAADERHAAAGDDALLDGRAGRVQRVLDARLLLLHLDLGRRADVDDGDAADELREALLELLAVVVARSSPRSARGSASRGASMSAFLPAPSTIVVLSLSTVMRLARPRSFERDVLELEAEVLGDRPCRR